MGGFASSCQLLLQPHQSSVTQNFFPKRMLLIFKKGPDDRRIGPDSCFRNSYKRGKRKKEKKCGIATMEVNRSGESRITILNAPSSSQKKNHEKEAPPLSSPHKLERMKKNGQKRVSLTAHEPTTPATHLTIPSEAPMMQPEEGCSKKKASPPWQIKMT